MKFDKKQFKHRKHQAKPHDAGDNSVNSSSSNGNEGSQPLQKPLKSNTGEVAHASGDANRQKFKKNKDKKKFKEFDKNKSKSSVVVTKESKLEDKDSNPASSPSAAPIQQTNSHNNTNKKNRNQPTKAISNNQTNNSISPWNFEVDYNDHFETPKKAYDDLSRLILDPLLQSTQHKTRGEVTIYDPYYCQGHMIEYLQELSFQKVINRNQDFYADIRRKNIPDYDLLITNPPYSGEHKAQLLQYLSSPLHRNRPFALLLPVYTITKSYWKDFLQRNASSENNGVLYLLPPEYYEYVHPENTGKDIPPFYSIWLLGNLPSSFTARILQSHQQPSQRSSFNPSASSSNASIRQQNPGLPPITFQQAKILSTIEEIVALRLVTEKRPNPKQRKKMKARLGQ